jgi:pyruvate-formate lyase-activating enzyme
MPWSLTDNPIGWLEVTDICNINCKGCYRSQIAGHRDLAELKEEIRMFRELRNCDGISIAGGEPLLHPELPEIVAHVRELGMKAVVLSNAMALDREALVELKGAGLEYLTLHVDQWQTRKGWTGKNEVQLLDLRQEIADRVDAVGGYHLTFGCTIYNENVEHVTAIADWARRNAGKVDGLVFITFRGVPTLADVSYQAPDKKVEEVNRDISYTTSKVEEIQLTSDDVWRRLQQQDPAFHSGAYLGGTVRASSFKWIVTARALSRHRVFGYAGPRVMEAIQHLHHTFAGTYPAYMPRSKIGPLVFGAGFIDPHLRRGAWNYLGEILRNPRSLLERVYVQSIVIVQAPDLLPDGSCDMCDSCPDMTFYKGELVRSCRWDEYRRYGALLQPSMHAGEERKPSNLVHAPQHPTLPPRVEA